MIRKILISIFLLYILIWFATANIIKSNIVNTIDNSQTDNLKISYNQVKVAGFPGRLKISLLEPKVKLIGHTNSKEISTDQLIFTPTFSFKKADITLGNSIKQVESFDEKQIETIVQSNVLITALVKFNKPIYGFSRTDNLKSMIKFLEVNNENLSVIHQNKECCNISDLNFIVNKTQNVEDNEMFIKTHLIYSSEENLLNFKKAELDLFMLAQIDEDKAKKTNSLKNINVDHLKFLCDDSAQIYLTGGLQLFKDSLPNGKLSFELTDYHKLIDKLIPNNWLLPRKIIKMVINKILVLPGTEIIKVEGQNLEPYEKIKLDISFSSKGIFIGSTNLLEFKLENNDIPEDNNQQEIMKPENDSKTIEDQEEMLEGIKVD
ncbi:MAG: hypothetical protein LN588_03630 [Rickettsia endosymbiont of Bryobia graminum]|nr:hypothetical protein [Rickettsia endosymbiont of Bryobia graminum]